jgi:serine-aspartate repeat-containing protein C/D/E
MPARSYLNPQFAVQKARLPGKTSLPRRRLRLETLEARHLLAAGSFEISGTVWNDANGDQWRDEFEPRLAGRTVYLDTNQNGRVDPAETRATTAIDDPATTEVNEGGTYRFTGLEAGTYHVREDVPAGWDVTTPLAAHVVALGNGGLEALRSNLTSGHALVSNLVSDRYDFLEGSTGTSIVDGGRDMYDVGNVLNTNLASAIPYTAGAIVPSDAQFGPGSKYFTAKYPGMFVLAAQDTSIDFFEISGATGTNGAGFVDPSGFSIEVNGQIYNVFMKQIYAAGDPSISQLVIMPDTGQQWHEYSSNPGSDQHRINGLENVDELYYILTSRQSGMPTSQDARFEMVRQFLSLVPRRGTVVENVDFGNRAEGKLSGYVWRDYDEDGQREQGEPGLADWTVFVDTNGNGTLDVEENSMVSHYDDPQTTSIDEAGYFAFSELPPGEVTVRVVAKAGWTGTGAGLTQQVRVSIADLSATLANLSIVHPQITAELTNRFEFLEGVTGTEIVDGGANMYDVGNRLSTDRATNIAYTNQTVVAGDATFGPGSRYATAKHPGMFAALVANMSVDRFAITGNTGTGGAGRVVTAKMPLRFVDRDYTVFVKQIVEAATPSVVHIIVVAGDGTGIEHEFATNTGDDFHALSGLGGVGELYYLLVGQQNGALLADDAVLSMAQTMLGAVEFDALQAPNASFGQRGNYRIEGTQYHDVDGDAVRDANETGIAGWTVYIDENDNSNLDLGEPQTLTQSDDPATVGVDETGRYVFDHVPPGITKIRELRQAGWRQTSPTDAHEINLGLRRLSSVLTNLNSRALNISMQIPNRFTFSEGNTGFSILDGGSNMYDDGNYIQTNINSSIPYSDRTVADGDAYFGPDSQYFTAKYFGLWALGVSGMSIDAFNTSGYLGAAGQGLADAARLTSEVAGGRFTVFVKRVSGASTPSVNHLVIIPGDASTVSHGFESSTFYDLDYYNGLANEREMYYLLVSRQAGGYLADADVLKIANEFIASLPPPLENATGLDFGSTRVAELGGVVWRDANANGSHDANEPGIAGWTVYLDANNNGALDAGEVTAITTPDNPVTAAENEAGRYSFTNLLAGTYVVRRVVPTAWTPTEPADSRTVTLTFDPGTPNGNVALNVDFGNKPIGTIQGLKWNDLDADSVRDPNEPGLAGWTIYVDENDDGLFQPTEPSAVSRGDDPATPSANEAGTYTIEGVPSGVHRVREVVQQGWQQQFPFISHTAAIGVATLEGLLVNLNANHASITTLVPTPYEFFEGESGISIGDGGGDMYDGGNYLSTNLNAYLTYSNGTVAASDSIFGPGSRYFTAKHPGMFTMAVENMAIDRFVISGDLGADGGGQTEGAVITTSVSGQTYTLFIKRTFNAGDPSVNHIIVVPGGTAGLSHEFDTYTNNDHHAVSGLQGRPGIYYLLVARQSGGRLSDADATSIAQQFLALIPTAGTAVSGIDFGNHQTSPTGEIHGVTFQDSDRDGTRDANEALGAGWTIFLDEDRDGQLDPEENRAITSADDPATIGVDETGAFAFTGLSSGTYRVAQVNQLDWVASAPAENSEGRRFYEVTVNAGQVSANRDFGNYRPGADVELRGNGQVISNGDTTPSVADGSDFGTVEVGGDRAERSFSIFNAGELPLSLVGNNPIRIAGASAFDFSIAAGPAKSILAPGESTSFTIRFVPNSDGDRTASLEIDTDDLDEPTYRFAIAGTGYEPNIRAFDDVFNSVEDNPFITVATGANTIIPFGAGGWAINDEILRSIDQYPTDAQGRAFHERDFDILTSQTWAGPSAWDAPLTAPFDCTAPNCNGQTDALPFPKTNIHVPASSETTFLARRVFTLTAAQANSLDGTITYTCDSGCIFYINGVYAGASPNMIGYWSLPGTNVFTFDSGDELLPHATISGSFAALGIPLFEGDNVVAVEIHNDNTNSSDIGFDMSLTLNESVSGLMLNDELDGAARPLSISLLSQPVDVETGEPAGTVLLTDQSGNFSFTPRLDFHGRARFEYRVDDAESFSIGEAIIVVSSQNDAPLALADAYVFESTEPFVVAAAGRPLIEANDTRWYYMDDGSDQDLWNPSWREGPQANFEPAAAGWRGPSPAQLGFGEGDEHTTINDAGFNGGLTYYFYREFDTVGSPDKLVLDLKQDDGAAVYINGVEVVTVNLPTPHPYYIGALEILDEDGQVFHRYEIDTASLDLLSTGNTIAVEVHQFELSSSDVSFDLRLFDPAFGLLANDEDHDDSHDALRVANVSSNIDPLTVGTLDVHPDGTFTFTPVNTHVAGVYVFTYSIEDAAGGLSAPAPVTFTISTQDASDFMAVGDNGISQFITDEDTPLVIDAATGPVGTLGVGLLANDLHPGDENDPVTFILVSPPESGGTVVFHNANNGGFTYTPGANFDGIDTFVYQIHDGYTLSNVATASIVVRSVEDPPHATNDIYEVAPGAVLVVNRPEHGLLANDFDSDGDTVEGAQLVAGSGPTHGVLTLSANGTFTYTPDASYAGQDAFQYTVIAAGIRSAAASVIIRGPCASRWDLNDNGSVGLEDLAMLVGNFGRQSTAAATGDLDCDGAVGLGDLMQLRNRLIQATSGPSPSLTPAPAASAVVAQGRARRGPFQPENSDEALMQLVRQTPVAAIRRIHSHTAVATRFVRRSPIGTTPLSPERSQSEGATHDAIFADFSHRPRSGRFATLPGIRQ